MGFLWTSETLAQAGLNPTDTDWSNPCPPLAAAPSHAEAASGSRLGSRTELPALLNFVQLGDMLAITRIDRSVAYPPRVAFASTTRAKRRCKLLGSGPMASMDTTKARHAAEPPSAT